MKNFFERLVNVLIPQPKPRAASSKDADSRVDLMKKRPLHLATREYVPLESERDVLAYFDRLKARLVQSSQKRRPGESPFFRAETGMLPGKRRYFYLAPWNEAGWLFEQSPSGWVVSQAEKIVAQNTFLRRYEAWDIVTLHAPNDGASLIRVSSRRFGDELLSFPLYEEAMERHLGINLIPA